MVDVKSTDSSGAFVEIWYCVPRIPRKAPLFAIEKAVIAPKTTPIFG
jgi:hypothetical protein